jgi:hypothetical protein
MRLLEVIDELRKPRFLVGAVFLMDDSVFDAFVDYRTCRPQDFGGSLLGSERQDAFHAAPELGSGAGVSFVATVCNSNSL